ncbi:MAG: hypothetical protein E6I64_06555 [Chloroflexi bacterium]|nr:MAG: hypothetical protein E6I64_06555 [Chloroflexota bacterium]
MPRSRPAIRAFSAAAFPIAFASAVFIAAVGLPSTDSDTYWQLASGRWMLDHGELLRRDVFSATITGAPLGIGEWLGQLVFAAAFAAGGWAGVVVLRSLLLAIAGFFVARLAHRGGIPWWISLPLSAGALLVSRITWTDRPQLFTLALVPALLDLLLTLPGGWSRRLVVLPPLFGVWASIHGGYLLGLIVLAIFALHSLIADGRRALPLAAITIASAAFTFLSPAPLEIAGAAIGVAPPRFIAEYFATDVLSPAGAIFAAYLLAILGTALLRGGTLLEAMLLPPLLYLGLSAQRHMVFFVIAAIPFLAPRLRSLVARDGRAPELPAAVATGLAAVLLVAAVASAPAAPAAPDVGFYPAGALATLRSGSGVLLNEYDWGGYLIFNLPERPVFIDGRYVPYLGGVLDDYRALVGLHPGWRDLLDRYRVSEVVLRMARPLAVALREDGWTVRAADPDGRWIVLGRP